MQAVRTCLFIPLLASMWLSASVTACRSERLPEESSGLGAQFIAGRGVQARTADSTELGEGRTRIVAVSSDTVGPNARRGSTVRTRVGLLAGYTLVRDTLLATTRVPVVVPRRVWGDATDDSLYVRVDYADTDSYSLFFSVNPRCQGGSVCRAGGVDGELLSAVLDTARGQPVRLSGGRHAVYVPEHCGAGCSDAKLVWTDHQYRYSVGLHRGRFEQLVRMVESVMPIP